MAKFTSKTAKEAAAKQKRGASKATKAIKELLSPHAGAISLQLVQAAKEGQPWAVKLFLEYLYGKPKQSVDVNSIGAVDINITYSDVKED